MLIEDNNVVYSENATLILSSFNINNKENGFYHKLLNKRGNPGYLIMESAFTYIQDSHASGFVNVKPLKAKNVGKWLVKRQSANDAPNFFLTTDFKNYKRLTDLQPQKGCNWLTAELITWKQLDNSFSQGILYKPQNFNPLAKYPIILNYYEELSPQIASIS